MSRKFLLLSFGLVLLVVFYPANLLALNTEANPIPDGQILKAPDSRAACTMYLHNSTGGSYCSFFQAGMGSVSYFNPASPATGGCAQPWPYPFEITAFSFSLIDWPGCIWPVDVDIVVYEAPGDSCLGPGAELCRYSLAADKETFGDVTGTYTFPTPCCIYGPVFIGLEYVSGEEGTTPSIIYDSTSDPPSCDHWLIHINGYWYPWDVWGSPTPGPALFWVDGETRSDNCRDNVKMHFPQYPDEDGWDVWATQSFVLADDWTCIESGPVKDIHFWGSWFYGDIDEIEYFVLSIHEDIPADPPDYPYSRPGITLWEYYAYAEDFVTTLIDPGTVEGWYDPAALIPYWDNNLLYFQYDIYLPEEYWFDQEEGTVYWLNISAVLPDGSQALWGWKSTEDHHLDGAVWAFWGELNWIDMWQPPEPLVNWFEGHLDNMGNLISGWGEEAYTDPVSEQQWFYYEEYYWWNVWFYDHPFDDARFKEIQMVFHVHPEPGMPEVPYLYITANWTTPEWSLLGLERPPLPDDFKGDPPIPEDQYIVRGDPLIIENYGENYQYIITVPDYNPEWVSLDIQGMNVWVEGYIQHTCNGSLDLAFVITGGEDEGACCYPDPPYDYNCVITTEDDCITTYGGFYQGDNTVCGGIEACCLQDGTCVMADALCCVNELGGSPQGPGSACTALEACCMSDNTCAMYDPLCCIELGGDPQGAGSACTALEACCMTDNSCGMYDPLCCTNMGGTPQAAGTSCTGTQVCCLEDGNCLMIDPLCCNDLGGTVDPYNSYMCMGDWDFNEVDDACEAPDGLKWRQMPDLLPTGMDVDATTEVMADDFLCTQEGPITEIHIWGSWIAGMPPGGDPGNVAFFLSIHSDLPAGAGVNPWSSPNELLWTTMFEPGTFEYRQYGSDVIGGWYNPSDGLFSPEYDFTCWEYIFRFDESNWFEQYGTPEEPVVYWLDVHAVPSGQGLFGWKTSIIEARWNDDAAWAPSELVPPEMWTEVIYPDIHPHYPASVNLAFTIIGGECDCEPGEVNETPPINILDIVALINYKYKGGAAPAPYALCNGDPNCDCVVNILDIVLLINYKYKGGTAPCTCEDWLTACGPPLRK